MIKVNKRVVGPELRPQFLPAHHFPRAFEQQTQDLESLLSHLHFRPELPQLTGAQIERIGTEQGGSRGDHFHVRKARGRKDLQARYDRDILRLVRTVVKKLSRLLPREHITYLVMTNLHGVVELLNK